MLIRLCASLPTDGLWNCDKPEVLKLGVLPVKAMLAVEDHLWAASGGQVFIISTHTHRVEVGGPSGGAHCEGEGGKSSLFS